jgi:hypothetical protein
VEGVERLLVVEGTWARFEIPRLVDNELIVME